MRVAVSVLRAKGRLRARAPAASRCGMPRAARAILVIAALLALPPAPATAETLPEALVRTYQGNPQLNAERARVSLRDQVGKSSVEVLVAPPDVAEADWSCQTGGTVSSSGSHSC